MTRRHNTPFSPVTHAQRLNISNDRNTSSSSPFIAIWRVRYWIYLCVWQNCTPIRYYIMLFDEKRVHVAYCLNRQGQFQYQSKLSLGYISSVCWCCEFLCHRDTHHSNGVRTYTHSHGTIDALCTRTTCIRNRSIVYLSICINLD